MLFDSYNDDGSFNHLVYMWVHLDPTDYVQKSNSTMNDAHY